MTQRRLPAEWEEQSGVMLTWPQPQGDWQVNYPAVENTFLEIGSQISLYEQVLIVCANKEHQLDIQNKLKQAGANIRNIQFSHIASNDSWARDHGPITVFENHKPHLLDFTFNGWGNKYPSELDNYIPQQLSSNKVFGETPMESVPLVLEGGSVESDGNGTLLTTSRCLLNPNRNPGLNQEAIEEALRYHLGARNILWLNHGEIAGDDTDSHIDTLARFCNSNTIAYVSCDDPDDEHFELFAAMRDELEQFRDTRNKPYRLVPLPLPSTKQNNQGKQLPATYANFLIINDAVLAPTYNDDKDKEALNILQECFPGRKIINIDCSALIEQSGSLHCVTMQLPIGILD